MTGFAVYLALVVVAVACLWVAAVGFRGAGVGRVAAVPIGILALGLGAAAEALGAARVVLERPRAGIETVSDLGLRLLGVLAVVALALCAAVSTGAFGGWSRVAQFLW